MNKTFLAVSLLALAGLSSAASAASGDNWYVRGDIGSGRLSASGIHDDATAGSVGFGYWFNQNFALETSYNDFGDHHDLKVDSWGLGVVGKAHLQQAANGWFLDGRAGVSRLHASFHGISGSDTKAYAGAGLGYDFNANFGLSLNYLWNDAGSGVDAQMLTVGLEGRF